MNNFLVVDIPHAADELSEEFASILFFQVLVSEDS